MTLDTIICVKKSQKSVKKSQKEEEFATRKLKKVRKLTPKVVAFVLFLIDLGRNKTSCFLGVTSL